MNESLSKMRLLFANTVDMGALKCCLLIDILVNINHRVKFRFVVINILLGLFDFQFVYISSLK